MRYAHTGHSVQSTVTHIQYLHDLHGQKSQYQNINNILENEFLEQKNEPENSAQGLITRYCSPGTHSVSWNQTVATSVRICFPAPFLKLKNFKWFFQKPSCFNKLKVMDSDRQGKKLTNCINKVMDN